jgi:hypothetical protein
MTPEDGRDGGVCRNDAGGGRNGGVCRNDAGGGRNGGVCRDDGGVCRGTYFRGEFECLSFS